MEMKHFVGIDVSKLTLDITWLGQDGKKMGYKKIGNARKEIKALVEELQQVGIKLETTVFCMEHTGVYNLHLAKYLCDNKANIWLEPGHQIKMSMGTVRGKDDKIDSERIAIYAFDNRHKIKLWKAPREAISQMADLITYRALLIKNKKALDMACKEKSIFKPKGQMKTIQSSTGKLLKALNKEIEQIENQVMGIIKGDEKLSAIYGKITSVKGVGFVTAVYIIVATNEFININDPKKFSCYSGVAPFRHKSGTSIRGKDRVSHMANKTIKTLLHLCAASAVHVKGELQDYYFRKVAEGKNKMLVLNAIRNKIVLRIFACVNNNRYYEEKYQHKLA